MLSRLLMVLSVVSMLASVAMGAVCNSADTCYTTELSMVSGSQTNLQVSLAFQIDSTTHAVCGIYTGNNVIQDTTGTTANAPAAFYNVIAIGGGNPGTVSLNNLLEITAFNNVQFSATGGLVGVPSTQGTYTGTVNGVTQQGGTSTVALNNFNGPLYAGAATATSPHATIALPFDSPETCTANGGGDPFFSGFQGQQFFVAGEVGGVMNVISSFNLQFNARIIFLDNGEAMTPAEQERLYLLSEIRHAADPSVPMLDHTTYWSHPGNYFGEAGVAMIDGHRLYAKPGAYKDGFATVTLDDKPLAVSDEYVVLGSGVNAITIARPSTHRIIFRTVNVEFSLMNSDNFFNVEHSHLEQGWHKHAHFAGVMGLTAKPGFKWAPEMEKDVTVVSGDLFEFVAQPL